MLEGLRDASDHSAWDELVKRYRPLIISYARHSFGLGRDDAEDAAQEALNAFFEAYQKGAYDRQKGRLRKWLFGIATNQIKKWITKQARRREVQVAEVGSGTGFLARVPELNRLEESWEQQWRRALYRRCLELLRERLDPKTLSAYVQFAEQGVPAENVAAQLCMTANAVYLAKHHVLKHIDDLIPQLESMWDT